MGNYGNLSDQQLIALLHESDAAAYTEIFHRYKIILYKHAYKILGDYDEASDVIQELFLMIWQKRDTLQFRSSLAAYLYTALRNRIFDLIAHQQVVSRYVSSIQQFVESGYYQADEQLLVKELSMIIEREVAALPPKMRQVFELSRGGEMSYREIGETLGIAEGTVKLQVHNAMKILKPKISTFLSVFPFL